MAAASRTYLYTSRENPDFNNPQQMLKYLNHSAAGDNPIAQHILGNLYLRGAQGVPLDAKQAKRLFTSACQQNYAASCTALQELPEQQRKTAHLWCAVTIGMSVEQT